MGNRVVLVASEPYPLAATDFYQVLDTSDVPGGVVNIVTGDPCRAGADAGRAHGRRRGLVASPRPTSRREIERGAAGNLKRTWVNDGRARDWFGPAGEGRAFLGHATEVKTVWVPYGA